MSKETIGFLLLTVGGATATLYYVREAILGWNSKWWPITNGTVITSDVSSVYYETVTFFRHIKYEYIVESEKFSSSKVAFWDDSSSISERGAKGILYWYKVGTQVKVYYHPNKPELSVLKPGLSPSPMVLIRFGLGLLFFFVGLSNLIR
jgi:hypothetical protein